MQGLRDKRGQILPAILRCSWLRQASALLLECVETVQEFDDIQDLMHQYATMAHMTLSKIVFDLRSQWPVRRCRFWCLMLDADLPPLHLQAWPSCLHCTTLGDVMPFDALWPDEHELDLLWTDQECALFFDPRYGSDLRVLQHSHGQTCFKPVHADAELGHSLTIDFFKEGHVALGSSLQKP